VAQQAQAELPVDEDGATTRRISGGVGQRFRNGIAGNLIPRQRLAGD